MSMMCKLYKFLFRVLPINTWKVRLMDKHFSICLRCGEEAEEAAAGEKIKELLVSLEDSKALPAVWPRLQRKIQEEETGKPVPKRKTGLIVFHRWQWAAAATVLLLMMVLLPLLFSPGKKPAAIPGTGTTEEKVEEQVVVESVKINSQAAKIIYFNSKDPDKLIVWVKK